jgi:hypothetical protein
MHQRQGFLNRWCPFLKIYIVYVYQPENSRGAHPRPVRRLPAPAAPGVMTAGASGPRWAWRLGMRPQALITAAIAP